MKKRKILITSTLVALSAISLASCGSKSDNDYEVGVLQYTTHTALDKATLGFKDALTKKVEEAGKNVKITVKNPEADTASLLTMANQLVRNSDLVLGNATPAATQLISSAATEGKNKLPILFTSVTDPVSAKLVSSWTSHKENVTGTSDLNPTDSQMDLIFDFDSTVDKIGFLYNVSETNSKTQVDSCKAYLQTNYPNAQALVSTVSQQSEISSAVNKLISDGCDAIYLPTDNLMASNMTVISNITNPKKIPIYCGESGMVDNGGTMTLSISYYELGYTTGEMAAEILLNGKKASEIDVVAQTEASKMEFAYNTSAMNAMNLTFSDTFKTKYKFS